MKHMIKIQRNRFFTFGIILAAFIAFGVFIQGCSDEYENFNDEKETLVLDNSKYLDMEIPQNGEFSDKDFEILDEAFQRAYEYLIVEEDTCFLTIHSAKEVNMSEGLFSLIELSVANTNKQYEMYSFFKEKNMEFTVKNPFQNNIPEIRLKSYSETVCGNQWCTTKTYLSHSEVIIVLNSLRTANGSAATFGSIIAGALPGGGAASALIAIYGFLNDSKFSNIQDSYIRSGSTTGITLIESTVWSPTGIQSTVYGASYR